jgi:histidinol-phosphate/aromatic aminotransferase/cobyric acid decarboxylase-like protein
MYFPNASMLSEMRGNLARLLHNYGSRQDVLNQKMAYHLLCDNTRVVALNGASQVFPILRDLFAGKRVLIPEPTFGEYPRMFPDADTYRDDIGVELRDLAAAAETADVVVLVNPNNPSGTTQSSQSLYEFMAARPGKTFVVDESFIDFSGYPSMVSLLEAAPLDNVLCVKSLSKTLGVPGIRLGYVYSANAALVKHITDRVPIWNLNSVAEYMLEIILKHRSSLAASFVNTAKDRARLIGSLATVPGVKRVFPSGGNFVTFELQPDAPSAATVVRRLLAMESIYLKDVSAKFEGRSLLRVAVRLPDENARLVSALHAALTDRSVAVPQPVAKVHG